MVEVKKAKIKLSELRDITGSLSKVLSQDLPVKQAYRLSKLAKAVQAEIKELNEHRERLIKKYGERDEKGNLAVKSRVDEFQNEFTPILDEEVELSFIPLDMNDVDGLKVSPLDIANLEPFIDEKSESLLEDAKKEV